VPTPATPPAPLAEADALQLLRHGGIAVEGRLVDASNTTLRGEITLDGVRAHCVYKPVAGERPLWDFPDGTLAGREVAAFLVSQDTGWGVVPPTVLRDGPLGVGACQLWVDEADEAEPVVGFAPGRKPPPGWLPITAAHGEDGRRYVLAHADDPRLARMAIFDAVINNADRKGGHVLLGAEDRLYGVDHGVSFHTEDKLRTVLWGWVNEPLPADAVEVLTALRDRLAGGLGEALSEHLTVTEVKATRRRVDRLLTAGRFPLPPQDWPAVPWPPV
jgi:uncharacterized repeat protein (TIGR03843 family)